MTNPKLINNPGLRYAVHAGDFAAYEKYVTGQWMIDAVNGEIITRQTGKAVKFHKNNSGYLTIRTSYRGKKIDIVKHRAVWVIARGIPIDIYAEIDHINGNKEDCRIQNLRLSSRRENATFSGTLTMEKAEEIRGCLEDVMTAPEDVFEKALYYEAFVQASKEITDYFRNLYNETIQSIRFEKLTSDVYEVVERFSENKVVDKEKLKAENPSAYYSSVHIKGSDAAKLLSPSELYSVVVNKIGKERASKYEQVNVDDLRYSMPELEAAEYLKTDGRSKGFFIEVKKSVNLV